MRLHHADERVTLWHGDAIEVLRSLADASVDAVCTDPPYGLEFMGKSWDRFDEDSRARAGMSGTGYTDGAERLERPSFLGGLNPKCRSCGKWQRGGSPCSCDSPNFPNERRARSAAFGEWCTEWATECLRVLKPGGHMLAFGGTRTWHRLACAVEDAGFEVRDSIAWLYGSGFPKSLDVSKAIDKRRDDSTRVAAVCRWLNAERVKAGVTHAQIREALGLDSPGSVVSILSDNAKSHPRCPTLDQWEVLRVLIGFDGEMDAEVTALNGRKGSHGEAWESREITGAAGVMWDQWEMRLRGHSTAPNGRTGERRDIPATPDAERWQGWGTALKPAFEPVVVARKPLAGTVAATVLEHGTGALNIDGCRVESGGDYHGLNVTQGMSGDPSSYTGPRSEPSKFTPAAGRWPTNVVLDDSQAAALDEQSGESRDGVAVKRNRPEEGRAAYDASSYMITDRSRDDHGYGGQGGASRFFPTFRYEAKAPTSERPKVNGTAHPTVKPLDLMRWLVRLVTPPGGTVLEPFAGSGTTVEACIVEGFRCVAIEREADYLPLIEARIARRLDPVRAIELAGEDGGLFDLLGGEGA